MNVIFIAPRCLALSLVLLASVAVADPVEIDSANMQNGVTEIYSSTFDGPPSPPGDPFFGGVTPPLNRAIQISPNPSTVVANVVPGGFTNVQTGFPPSFTLPPDPGSFLDLTRNPGNTMLTIAGGTITMPTLGLIIAGTPDTIVLATNSGIIFNPTPVTVPIDSNGIAVFEVDPPSVGVAADFSTFSDVVGSDCTGPLCAVIPALTLDMLRYRLIIDFDPTFSSFTADFTGQTANFSMVFATLNSVVPNIAVTDSTPPVGDQQLAFGTVTELSSADQTVTVTNVGAGNLVIGTIAQSDPLATPFIVQSDTCSGQTLTAMAACTITVRFTPASSGLFNDTFDIPSNDAGESSITVSVNGTGTPILIPNITVTDSVPPADDLLIPFGSVSQGLMSDQRVTVSNDGNAALTLGQVAMADPLIAPLSVINDTCSLQIIPAAGSCTFDVRFEPTTIGNFQDSLDIPSDDPDEPSVTVNSTGTGEAVPVPDITVTDSVPPTDDLLIPFGDITELFTSEQVILVANDGTADLVVGQLALANPLAAPFDFRSDACSGQTLAPTETCTVLVQYTPPSVGTNSDSFDIPSNDPDEASVVVSLSGSGVVPPTSDDVVSAPDGAESGFFGMALNPRTLAALVVLLMLVRVVKRRRIRSERG